MPVTSALPKRSWHCGHLSWPSIRPVLIFNTASFLAREQLGRFFGLNSNDSRRHIQLLTVPILQMTKQRLKTMFLFFSFPGALGEEVIAPQFRPADASVSAEFAKGSRTRPWWPLSRLCSGPKGPSPSSASGPYVRPASTGDWQASRARASGARAS